LQYFFNEGTSQEILTNAAVGTVSGVFPGFNYILSGTKASVVLNALSTITHVNVISSPELMVLDHQSAVLQVGDQVPIPVQQAQSVINPDSPLVNSIDYRDTGVILRVSPRVNSNGLVTLDISQEVSDVTTTTTSSLDAPTIEQRRIQSTVSVQDGETLALGGLIKDSKTRMKSGIPLLADIPVLGALFRNTTNTSERTELLVLLSPHVVRNMQEAHDVTEELRHRMQGLTHLGPLIQ
jgi:general secretion pathway protein D